MNVNKIIVTRGAFKEKQYTFLVSFDENDNPLDIIELNSTLIGQTYLATVEKVLKDVDSSILKLSSGCKGYIENKKLNSNEFVLYQSTKNKVSQGDKFFVEIVQDKKENKPYTCCFKGLDCVEDNSYSAVIKAYCDFVGYSGKIISDICQELSLIDVFGDRIIEYDKAFLLWDVYSISSLLEKATRPIVYLKNDSNIIIEQTKAATIIDVNSASSKKKTSAFEINYLAAKEIMYQLRLREISGIIIIDFLKMNKEEELKLLEFLKELAKEDSCFCGVYGFTRLGLFELTRARKRTPLAEIIR